MCVNTRTYVFSIRSSPATRFYAENYTRRPYTFAKFSVQKVHRNHFERVVYFNVFARRSRAVQSHCLGLLRVF